MASIEEILGKQINSVKALKAEIKSLQDSLVGLDAESQEFKDTTTKLTAAQDELNKVTKAGKQENDAAKDSIVGMKNEYKALYDQYKLLSDEQRNSGFGKEMAASLETLSQKINETQKGVGSFKDNIGNYAGSVQDAFNKMGMSVGALKGPLDAAKSGGIGLNTVFKTLAKNPILLAITAIVAILAKAAAAIKDNEELTNRLKEAMAAFKPVIDAVANAFDFLAGIIVKVVEGMAKVGEKILSIIPGYREAAKSHKELAKATDELTKKQRENNVVNSQKQAEIERLREEASATDDVVEKKRLLEEAKAKQAEVDEANIAIAQEELRVLEEYAAKTANSAAENDKLAEAQKKVNDAIAQGERNARMYNKQLDNVTKSTRSATSSGKNYREEAKKLHQQLIDDNKDEITKLTEKYEKEKKLLEKYHYDTTLLTKKYNTDVNKIIKEQEENRRETILAGYRQERSDVENQLNYLRKSGNAWFADSWQAGNLKNVIIPEVKGISDAVDYIFNNLDDHVATTLEDILNTDGFKGLGKEYDVLKEKVDIVNAKYGLSITTLNNLKTTLSELNEEQVILMGKATMETHAKNVSDSLIQAYKWAFVQIKELGIGKETRDLFDPGTWNFDYITEHMLEKEYGRLNEEKKAYEIELANFKGTQDQKLEMLQNYYSVVEEMENRHRELSELNQQRTQEMVNNLADAMDNIGGALSTVKGSYESLIDSELKAGKIDETQAKDKKKRMRDLEIAQQAFAIATIAADAASGLFTIWKGYATETGVINAQTAAAAGPGAAAVKAGLDAKSLVSAIAKSVSLASTATAQIMAARNGIVTAVNNFSAESGGGSVGVAATPYVIDSAPYEYARTIQTQDDEDYLNQRPIVCSIVDIEDAMDARKVRVTESSF